MTNVHVLLNALNLISMPNTIRVSGTLYIYTLSLYVGLTRYQLQGFMKFITESVERLIGPDTEICAFNGILNILNFVWSIYEFVSVSVTIDIRV